MEWEEIGKVVGKLFLIIIEYSFKLCAGVSALITVGTRGSFSEKISTGFTSLSGVLHNMINVKEEMVEMGTIINDYNTQTASMFAEKYGPEAVSGLLVRLNGSIEYLIDVFENLSRGPLVTIAATLLAFLSFYLLAWVLRFARQKGLGSFLVRMERKLGDRIFRRKPSVAPAPTSQNTESKSVTKPRVKVPAKKKRPHPASAERRNKTKKESDDIGPDSKTLTYLLESARSSS